MVSSSLSAIGAADGSSSMLPSRKRARVGVADHGSWLGFRFGAVVAAALVTGALLIAPEQPAQLASICERHHSSAACRVW
ncbi:MAG: serine protease inhibitor [Prochlorococcus sp.]